MYDTFFNNLKLYAKIYAFAMGDRTVSLDLIAKDAIGCMLKRMADQKWTWSYQQKEYYKSLVDFYNQVTWK